jgi:hypothetical protein
MVIRDRWLALIALDSQGVMELGRQHRRPSAITQTSPECEVCVSLLDRRAHGAQSIDDPSAKYIIVVVRKHQVVTIAEHCRRDMGWKLGRHLCRACLGDHGYVCTWHVRTS